MVVAADCPGGSSKLPLAPGLTDRHQEEKGCCYKAKKSIKEEEGSPPLWHIFQLSLSLLSPFPSLRKSVDCWRLREEGGKG